MPRFVGSVPVFSGSPNIRDFAPSSKSFINVDDFQDAASLAKYLNYLIDNPAEYLKYLEWKEMPLPASFNNITENSLYFGTGPLYGEAQHHGYKSNLNMCDWSTRIKQVLQGRL